MGIPHGATAERPHWPDLPASVRALIEGRLGAGVASAQSAGGGFTSGFASVVGTGEGARAFVKAVPRSNAVVADAYLREARIVPLLPVAARAPRVLWHDEVDGWVVVGFEAIPGRPPRRPWRPAELATVVAAVTAASRALTPRPPGLASEPIAVFGEDFRAWRTWSTQGIPDPCRAGRAAGIGPDRLAELASLEARWTPATEGDTALHFDLRDDNVLIGQGGTVHLCDWNWLVRGAGWVDLVGLLIAAHGDGLDVAAVVEGNPLTAAAAPEDLDALLAALGGYFARAAAQPLDFPASPWLRRHQAWYRDATLDLLAVRRGWPR